MLVAQVSFPVPAGDRRSTADTASDLLTSWYKNGQIVDACWLLADRGHYLEAVVRIAEPVSLEPSHHNVYSQAVLDKLLPVVPRVALLGPEPNSSRTCICPASSALVLFTHYLSPEPPVRCLDCFGPVPLYRLPHVHDQEHSVLLQWAADYRACDTLQMHCTTGERFGERQLGEHDSSLARNGRALCAELEFASGTAVYYYLHKMRSRGRASELERRCPACDAPWLLERPLHGFDFRCEPCRLVSSIASDAS
ncbi:MAG TPA: DUF2310 family Zn-ribbon-containing protein [Polyangiaceae bacterium]